MCVGMCVRACTGPSQRAPWPCCALLSDDQGAGLAASQGHRDNLNQPRGLGELGRSEQPSPEWFSRGRVTVHPERWCGVIRWGPGKHSPTGPASTAVRGERWCSVKGTSTDPFPDFSKKPLEPPLNKPPLGAPPGLWQCHSWVCRKGLDRDSGGHPLCLSSCWPAGLYKTQTVEESLGAQEQPLGGGVPGHESRLQRQLSGGWCVVLGPLWGLGWQ